MRSAPNSSLHRTTFRSCPSATSNARGLARQAFLSAQSVLAILELTGPGPGSPAARAGQKIEGRCSMRSAILLAAALALSASAAQAQGGDRDRDDDDSWRERREYREDRSRRDDDHGWHHRSGMGGGARFFLRSGDTRLGVVCDRGESMRNCVEAALTLFDKIRQAGPSGTSGATGGSTSPAPRP